MDVAYEDFYPSGVEPLEPNITSLLDPGNLKWKDLVTPGLGIPTEWNKEVYDSLSKAYSIIIRKKNEKMKELSVSGASSEVIKEMEDSYDAKIFALRSEINNFIFNHPLKDKIGAFEGAGYKSEGLYRPTVNSLMLRFDENNISYGKVNERAIIKMIEYYTKK